MPPLRFSRHAVQRMFERGVGLQAVKEVVEEGEMIEQDPADRPWPSRLLLGFPTGRPLHVMVADEPEATTIVTVYEPDPALWSVDFRRRRTR